jgi:CubicO group peptidase (beta-lactamase class C family)
MQNLACRTEHNRSGIIYISKERRMSKDSVNISSAKLASVRPTIERILSNLLPVSGVKKGVARSLAERMVTLGVPGVSIAVIHHGALEWAEGFGVTRVGGAPITVETLFQAASISKSVVAMAVLHLVQKGRLSLDADVNSVLRSWKLPSSPIAAGKSVTVRQLLGHTGGINVQGFPGYAAGKTTPTLVQILDGAGPANTPAIRIAAPPGTKWDYSGGGYTIMQQLLLDVCRMPFPRLLNDTVMAPLNMTHSTFQQPLPAELESSAAMPHDLNGDPIPGGGHTYPEMAAAGLWSTPSDLARFIIEIQSSLQGKSNHVLSPEMTRQMLGPGLGNWGLGFRIGGSCSAPQFSHHGCNHGFESILFAYEREGMGAVVMTNAHHGSVLAAEIIQSIATEYNWPDYHPDFPSPLSINPRMLPIAIGKTYRQASKGWTFLRSLLKRRRLLAS